MSDVSDAKCTCCKRINDYCCKTHDATQPVACCDTDGNIDDNIKHDWTKNQCPTDTTTPVICKTDRDCHKNRATIVSPALVECSRRHRTVFSKEYNGKITAYFYEKETEGGKCALALTPGEQQICKSDEDCHRHNPDMVCVSHYGTVITKIVNGNMVTKRNLHETETGKCTLDNKLPNIVDSVASTPELSTLFTAIVAARLVDILKGDGPFTVLAPNDDAFAKLPTGTLDDLLKPENIEKLKAVLLRHVVPGEFKAASVPEGTTKIETAGGEEISVVNNSGVRVESNARKAKVIKTDLMASNGVIHLVDSVF